MSEQVIERIVKEGASAPSDDPKKKKLMKSPLDKMVRPEQVKMK